jgi:hypothetical protein
MVFAGYFAPAPYVGKYIAAILTSGGYMALWRSCKISMSGSGGIEDRRELGHRARGRGEPPRVA